MSDHYNGTDLLEVLLKHEVPFTEGNIIKYVFRWKKKGGFTDLMKAKDYLDRLIEANKKLTVSGVPYPVERVVNK